VRNQQNCNAARFSASFNPATDPQMIPPQRHRKFTTIRHQLENVLIKYPLCRCAGHSFLDCHLSVWELALKIM